MPDATPPRTWRSLLAVVVPLVLVVLAAEAVVHRLAPMPRRDLEVDTGVSALQDGNPEIVVLGSSHAGAYLPLIDRLGPERVVVVTEEGGTMSAFDWVYRHRLQRFIDEKRPDGRHVRDRLRHLVLITTYWDTCPATTTLWYRGLPARAWQWRHYFADVAVHGVSPDNHNFPYTAMKRLFADSMFIQDRGLLNLRGQLRGDSHPDSLAGRKAAWAKLRWTEIANEGTICHDPDERGKLEGIIGLAKARGLEVTIVAFPQMAELLSPVSRRTTLKNYADYVDALGRTEGVRVVHHTETAPLVYDDFEVDCDHLKPDARGKYVDWALENGLEFLKSSVTAQAGGAP